MGWKEETHNGYTVLTETIKTFEGRPVYGSEFSIAPGSDFTIICNYGTTNLSASAHVELYYADVPGGTFIHRGNTVGGMNATSAAIDNAKTVNAQNISTTNYFPRYKLRVVGNDGDTAGGGVVKFSIYYARGEVV